MVILDESLLQGTTSTYQVNLVNESGQAIPGSALSALTLTYYDQGTLTVLNNRLAQNVLNANGVTIDGNGLLTWNIVIAETIMISATKERELHVALWTWTWASGTKVNRHEVGLYIERVTLG